MGRLTVEVARLIGLDSSADIVACCWRACRGEACVEIGLPGAVACDVLEVPHPAAPTTTAALTNAINNVRGAIAVVAMVVVAIKNRLQSWV